MEDNFLAWKKAFEDFDILIKKEDYFPLEGLKLIDVAIVIGKKYGLQESYYPEVVNHKNKYYLEDNKFSFYPGVKELVEQLKNKGFSLAIVSASPKEKLEKTVPKSFLDNFHAIISGDDINLGKPSPEPYLNAMKKLQACPKECIIIENAPLGIKSAKTAGAHCIAICSTLGKSFLLEADEIVDTFSHLVELSSIKNLL